MSKAGANAAEAGGSAADFRELTGFLALMRLTAENA
jgi:hypothetical protein